MTRLAVHRPLWFAVAAALLVLGWDVFWLLTFVEMETLHSELGDMAVRLSVIYSSPMLLVFGIALILALCSLILAICGRGFRVRRYSLSSRIMSPLVCLGVWGFHRYCLWSLIYYLHAVRHPELLD